MPTAAPTIILTAGSITFANEWYQTKKVDWKVPIATLIAAAIFDGIALIDGNAATLLAVIALIGAVTTEFNGKSAAATVAGLFNESKVVKELWAPLAKV